MRVYTKEELIRQIDLMDEDDQKLEAYAIRMFLEIKKEDEDEKEREQKEVLH